MCGVFGYLSTTGRAADVDVLVRLAKETETRGNHAHGWAWLDKSGGLGSYKDAGPISAPAALERMVEMTRGAIAMIGHCRWVTHGAAARNHNNHPHEAGDGFFVHNGVISNYAALERKFGLTAATECDSEVLGLMFEGKFSRGPRLARWKSAIEQADHSGRLVTLCLWRDQFIAARAGGGNPLHTGHDCSGKYFASLTRGLPGKVLYLKPDHLMNFRLERGRFVEKAHATLQAPPTARPRGYWSKGFGADSFERSYGIDTQRTLDDLYRVTGIDSEWE